MAAYRGEREKGEISGLPQLPARPLPSLARVSARKDKRLVQRNNKNKNQKSISGEKEQQNTNHLEVAAEPLSRPGRAGQVAAGDSGSAVTGRKLCPAQSSQRGQGGTGKMNSGRRETPPGTCGKWTRRRVA